MKNIELLKEYTQTRNIRIRNQIAMQNIGLVRKVAHRISKAKGESFDDLCQEGVKGLLKAIERFKPESGCTLSSFAVPYIQGEILHYLRDKAELIKSPRQDREDYNAVQLTLRNMERLGMPITLDQALEACGIGRQRWQDILISTSRKPLKEVEENIAAWEPEPRLSLSAELSYPQFLALRLRYLSEWDVNRIAVRMGISEDEVNKLIASGVAKIEKLYGC